MIIRGYHCSLNQHYMRGVNIYTETRWWGVRVELLHVIFFCVVSPVTEY
jgi:hypothetical protein